MFDISLDVTGNNRTEVHEETQGLLPVSLLALLENISSSSLFQRAS
jgi:hypothetical protein